MAIASCTKDVLMIDNIFKYIFRAVGIQFLSSKEILHRKVVNQVFGKVLVDPLHSISTGYNLDWNRYRNLDICVYEYRGCSVIQKIDLELQGLPTKAEILFIILSVPVGVSQYSTVKYHNCYHSLNRFLRQHLFGWIAVMLSRRVISALYGNVMSDLGVQERPG